jgi:hypothetical protein
MRVQMSRRRFMQHAGLAAGASLAASQACLFGQTRTPASVGGVRETLVGALSGYARSLHVCEDGLVLAAEGVSRPAVYILLEFDGLESLQAYYGGTFLRQCSHPVAGGNTLSFLQDGVFCAVDALLPDTYAERCAALARGAGVAFTREAAMQPVAPGDPTPGQAATYAAWSQLCMGIAGPLTGPEDDFDGDGAANAYEFAMNSDPGDAGASGRLQGNRVTVDGRSCLALPYVEDRGKSGVRYEIQGASSLILADWTPHGITDIVTGGEGQWVYHRAHVPLDGPIRYLRLNITLTD